MSEFHRQAQKIFSAVLKVPVPERSAVIIEMAAGDQKLRELVERLLHHHDADEPFLEGIAHELHRGTELQQIGPYRVKERLGIGGMGIVYLAEQPRPNRLVAIKVLNRLIVSPEARHRFELEAELLGRLQHPGIAQVYESGTAQIGEAESSYIVMEYVKGLPLNQWFAAHPLDLRATVTLLIAIVDAVHHAHLRGVIHRDLKPENILIDESGRPKVLDFGIAGVMDGSAEDLRGGGTPGYMSPEQRAGSASTEPTVDVFALGVLAGEILPKQLPNDLRWVVATATSDDPTKRYQTAQDLRADLQRYLDRFPVLARPTSFPYRLRRAVQRHLILSVALMAITLTLVGGTTVSLLYAQREAQSARRADHESWIARRLAYAASLSAASSAIDSGHTFEARLHLERTPKELRGWEYHHLKSRLVDSRWSVMLAEPERFVRLLAGPLYDPNGDEIYVVHSERRGTNTEIVFTAWSHDGQLRRREDLFTRLPSLHGRERVGLQNDGLVTISSSKSTKVRLIDVKTLKTSEVQIPRLERVSGAQDLQSLDAISWLWNRDEAIWEPAIERSTYSPDGSELAHFARGTIRIWNRKSNELERELKHYGVCKVFYSANGKEIASTSADGSLQVQSLAAADAPVRRFEVTREWLRAGAFSPSGDLIAVGDDLGTIFVIDVESGATLLRMHGHGHRLQSLDFRPDGQSIVAVSRDGNLRTFPVLREERPEILLGHESYVYPVQHIPGANLLVSAGWDGSIRFWDASSGNLIASHFPGPSDPLSTIIPDLEVSPDGRFIAFLSCRVVDRAKRLRVIDSRTTALVADLGRFEPCTGLSFSPDGKTLVTTADAEALLFDTETWTLRSRIPARTSLVRFAPNGQLLVVSAQDQRDLQLWDLQTSEILKTFRGGASKLLALRFSPAGDTLAASYQDRSLRVWNVNEKGGARHLDEISLVYGLSFSPDGSRLAGGAEQGLIRIWNTQTWDEVVQLTGHEKYVWSLEWNANGSRLVSASGDGSLRFWDAIGLAEKHNIRQHHAQLFAQALAKLRLNPTNPSPQEAQALLHLLNH